MRKIWKKHQFKFNPMIAIPLIGGCVGTILMVVFYFYFGESTEELIGSFIGIILGLGASYGILKLMYGSKQ